MQKDQSYHEAAIKYNEGLAEFAENLAQTLEHPEVQRWCTAVGKQHRFHAKRHQSALNKILARESVTESVEPIADGLDVPELTDEEEPTEDDSEAEITLSAPEVFPDGCVKFHSPALVTCEFNPNKVAVADA